MSSGMEKRFKEFVDTMDDCRCGKHEDETDDGDDLDELIDAHWDYVEKTLEAHGTNRYSIIIARYHYKTAWRHGVKHERERQQQV